MDKQINFNENLKVDRIKQRAIDYINLIYDYWDRNSRTIIVWIILVLAFAMFQESIADLISKYSIITEREVKGKYFYSVFNIAQAGTYILFCWLIVHNYRFSKQLNFWIFLFFIYYILLKSNVSDSLIFLSITKQNGKELYSDIFFDIGILTTILYLRNLFPDYYWYEDLRIYIKKNLQIINVEYKSELQQDLPINGHTPIENDKIADKLLPLINNLKPQKAYVIGINGEWGNGKTSFLNRLEHKIKFDETRIESAPITFWFNAWQHQDEKSIINNFFNQLKKELSSYSGDAKRSINNYLSNLLALIDNKYSHGIKILSDDFLGLDLTTQDYYNNINNIISRVDRKIIVFVDDLDRLNKYEIIEVLRILRNIANFKNTIFLCGFDKSYILQTGDFSKNYLDKIFNLELNLPKLPQNGLLIYLNELIQLSSTIKEKDELTKNFNSLFDTNTDSTNFLNFTVDEAISNETGSDTSESKYQSIALSPSHFFETRRDVKRFYNILILNLCILEDSKSVILSQYLIFKLLAFKYSWLLNYFDNKRLNIWLGSDSTLKLNKKQIAFIDKNKSLELIDKLIIITVLERIFPDYEQSIQKFDNGINKRRYLPLYLNNDAYNQAFSFPDLIKALNNLEIEKLINDKIISNEHENYLLNDIKAFMLKEENLNSLDEFKQAINVLIKYLPVNTNEIELLSFIHLGEQKFEKDFILMAEEVAFNNITNIFGELLRALNLYFSDRLKDLDIGQASIDNYFSINKSAKSSHYDREYVKKRLIVLFKQLILTEKPVSEINEVFLDCTEFYSDTFGIRLYYKEITQLYKEYLKKNFEKVFINPKPEEILDFYGQKLLASIFVDDEQKMEIIKEISIILKENSIFSTRDLSLNNFLKNGLNNFVKYLKQTSKDLDKEDLTEDIIVYFKAYISNGFIKPTLVDINTVRHKNN